MCVSSLYDFYFVLLVKNILDFPLLGLNVEPVFVGKICTVVCCWSCKYFVSTLTETDSIFHSGIKVPLYFNVTVAIPLCKRPLTYIPRTAISRTHELSPCLFVVNIIGTETEDLVVLVFLDPVRQRFAYKCLFLQCISKKTIYISMQSRSPHSTKPLENAIGSISFGKFQPRWWDIVFYKTL